MAPQKKKKQPTPGYCRWCCSCCCTGFSIWAICFGLSWPANLDNKIQTAIYNGSVKNPADKNYEGVTQTNRKANLAGMFIEYYFFNVTNPLEVMRDGALPKVDELGPYVFQKYVTFHNIRYFDNKKLTGRRAVGEMEFMPGFSCDNCKLSDQFFGSSHFITMWFNGRKCPIDGVESDLDDNDLTAAHNHCKNIGKYGLFEPHSVEQLMYGLKEFGGAVILRCNNGHHVCPSHLKTCQDADIKAKYTGTGLFGTYLDTKIQKENLALSGYDEEGCKLPWEYARHKKYCTRGVSLGPTRSTWGVEKMAGRFPPLVDIDQEGKHGPAFDYEVHKKDVAAGTCTVWKDKDGNCDDNYADWVKALSSNYYQWFDNTPYDTTDDKELDTGFKMDDDTKPCKWDGSTNNIAGCPYMDHNWNYVISHGMFHPDRMNDKDNPSLPHFGILEKRNLELKYAGVNLVHGIKGKKYTIDPKHYKGSHENAKFGMPVSGAAYEDFPGDGVFPLPKITGGPPIFVTRPHWYHGGEKSNKWNQEMGMRKAVAGDDWSITYEPITGLPVTGSLKYQFNTMYLPSNYKVHEGNATTPVKWDYANLTISEGYFKGETVHLDKLGKDRNCGGHKGLEGCPIMMPYWRMEIQIKFTPNVLEKVKKLSAAMKKVKMLKTVMRFWAWGGITGLVCVGGCLAYHFFGSGARKD